MSAISAGVTDGDGRMDGTARPVTEALTIEVFTDLEAAEATWRELEARAVLSPYQRFDWIQAIIGSGVVRCERMAIAVARQGRRPMALLPLTISRELGIWQARIAGSALSNADWMIFDPAIAGALDKGFLLRLLREARRAARIDVFSLQNLPGEWQGHANPLLAFAHLPAPSHFYAGTLGTAPFIETRLNHKKRTNIRRGGRRLEEMYGAVQVRHATTPEELSAVHAAFLAQRGERFDEMGVTNVFATAEFVTFFRELGTASLGATRPALCLHALYGGEEILATSIGAVCGTHYSQYINSTASGPAAKYYLSGLLMAELCDELSGAGILSLDLGVGDFEYKLDWTEAQTVYNAVVPLTTAGRAQAVASRLTTAAKRTVKQHPALWSLAKAVRKVFHRTGRTLGG